MTTLVVDNLCKSFGGLAALTDFSLSISTGQLHGLIGPNGAGKTTCFNLLTGVYAPDAGQILLNNKRLTGRRPSAITAAGVARTFQNVRLFKQLSVLDNVRIGCHLRARHSLLGALLRSPGHARDEKNILDESMRLLSRFGLADRAHQVASSLAYGDQRRLEIARALALEPQVLLLDEPAAGMNPSEKNQLSEFIREIRSQFNLTIILIEHHVPLVMGLCDRIAVLNFGKLIALGDPAQVRTDPAVIEAYLGSE